MNLPKISITSVKLISLNFYKLTLSPVMNVYSSNFSSFIRSLLFTSVYGFSITEVKIFGVNNEFDTILGVKENVLNLILNLKGIVFKLKKNKVILHLNKKGFAVIRASDFYLNEWVEIINPDYIITRLSKGFFLNIVIKVEKGIGHYFINNKNYKKKKSLDGILLDVNFSPIKKVYYEINFEFLKNSFNFDKIDFYIKTNGSISAKKALIRSIKILLLQLFNIKKNIYTFENKKNLKIKISEVNFSNNSMFYINNMNIFFLKDLSEFTEKQLLKISKINFSFLKEVKNVLLKYNLYLKIKN